MDIKQYEVENKITNVLNLCVSKIIEIEKLIKSLNISDFSVAYKEKINNLKDFDFDDIIKSIKVEISEIVSFVEKNNSVWEDFNEQYKNYYTSRLSQIKSIAERFNNLIITSSNEYSYGQLWDLMNSLKGVAKRNSTFALYEHFKYGDKNYILFGKNGAGKTTLLNKISSEFLSTNTIVLNATRDIKYAENALHYQSEIDLLTALKTCDKGKTLFLLGKCLSDQDYKELSDGISPNHTIKTNVISIFDQLGLDRKLILNQHGGLKLGDDEMTSYSITNASDGERSAIFILLAVLLSPLNSFIFIDEPENHLNGALMRKLFDLLEKARTDVKFIFATHNIQFIQSRQNVELIYLEKTNKHHEWNFKKFEDYEDLPLEVVLNIEGTNDNIIFCEGEDRSSLDCKLYEILFPDFEIVPVHGCENVEKQTELLNNNKLTFKKEAKGIVDNDFKNKEEIERLKLKNITVLGVNEIENIFILPCCLESMANIISNTKSVDEIKAEIIAKINSKIDEIKKDFATKLLRKIQFKNKFKKIDDIESDLDIILTSNKTKFLEEYQTFESGLLDCIKNKNYESLMRIVPGKMIKSDAVKIVGFSNDALYVNKLLSLINTETQLKEDVLKHIEI